MFEKLLENPDIDVEYEDDEFDIDELLELGVAHIDEVCSTLVADQENGTCEIQRKLWLLHGDATRWVEDEVDLEDKIKSDSEALLKQLGDLRSHIEVVEMTLTKMKNCCETEEED